MYMAFHYRRRERGRQIVLQLYYNSHIDLNIQELEIGPPANTSPSLLCMKRPPVLDDPANMECSCEMYAGMQYMFGVSVPLSIISHPFTDIYTGTH